MARRAFKLPDIGEGVVEGEIVTWHVEVGSSVSEDDAIVDVMTDKSTVTIPSPYSGTIVSLNGDVGDMVAVGAGLLEECQRVSLWTMTRENILSPINITSVS